MCRMVSRQIFYIVILLQLGIASTTDTSRECIVKNTLLMGSSVLGNNTCADQFPAQRGVLYHDIVNASRRLTTLDQAGIIATATFRVLRTCHMQLGALMFTTYNSSVCSVSCTVQRDGEPLYELYANTSTCGTQACPQCLSLLDIPQHLANQRYGPTTLNVTVESESNCQLSALPGPGPTESVFSLWLQFNDTLNPRTTEQVTTMKPTRQMNATAQQIIATSTVSSITSTPTLETTNNVSDISTRPDDMTNITVGDTATPSQEKTIPLWLIGGASVGGGVFIAVIGITLSCVIVYVKRTKRQGGGSKPFPSPSPQGNACGDVTTGNNYKARRGSVVYDVPITSPSSELKQKVNAESSAGKHAVPMYESMAYGISSCA